MHSRRAPALGLRIPSPLSDEAEKRMDNKYYHLQSSIRELKHEITIIRCIFLFDHYLVMFNTVL